MNLMDLFVKIGADTSDFDKDVEKTESKVAKLGSAIGHGLATAAKVGAAAVGVASAAVGALAKQAIDGFADYEQLVGGVETLFKDSADVVMGYAENAYKTAGLTANQYMETVTSFSASLLQSLGGDTEKAANVADMAITDMADNANKMGTSMESIQVAYQGFAKQNYTMLDNLKLGYGGTKGEMERLLADASKISGVKYNLNNLNDVYEAIHVIQTELGITGTTAKEASTTISGSLASMKSAWSNLVTGLANNDANLDSLINNFVDTAETAFGNILPVAEKALNGVAKLVEKLTPVIADKLPGLIESLLPMILNAATTLVNALVKNLPSIIKVLLNQAPYIMKSLVDSIVATIPELLQVGLDIIVELAYGIANALPTLVPTIVDIILNIIDILLDNIDLLVDASIAIIMGLTEGIINALPKLLEKVPVIIAKLVEAIIDNVPSLLIAAGEIVGQLVYGIISNLGAIGDAASQIVDTVGGFISELPELALEWGADLIAGFINGIKSGWSDLKNMVSNVAQSVRDFIGFSEPKDGPLSNFHTYAPDMMELFAKGIKDNEDLVTDQIKKSFNFEDAIGGDLDVNATGEKTIRHTGTIRVEGVNNEGEFVAASEYAIEDIVVNIMKRQARLA